MVMVLEPHIQRVGMTYISGGRGWVDVLQLVDVDGCVRTDDSAVAKTLCSQYGYTPVRCEPVGAGDFVCINLRRCTQQHEGRLRRVVDGGYRLLGLRGGVAYFCRLEEDVT